MRKIWFYGVLPAFFSLNICAAEAGLITALSGSVKLLDDKEASAEIKPFVKVRRGDRLKIGEANESDGRARLQIVYFDSARQETWTGGGTLEIESQSAKVLKGSLRAEVRMLPEILVKQLSRTPSSGGNVKAGMIRLRAMASLETEESAEKAYADLRQQAVAGDRIPELYLLVSYFELRAYDKLEALLAQLGEKAPGDAEVAALAALYSRAIGEAKAEKR
ncbi:MAG: hypothetical protein HY777_10255 [Betaproteobacteria bacterium]|nr:hypothetical protein [Betaproteobacteria bacterium]